MIREWHFHKISPLAVFIGIMFTALFGIMTASMYQQLADGLGNIFLIFTFIIFLATLRSFFYYSKGKEEKETILLGPDKIEWYVISVGKGELKYQDLISVDLYIYYKNRCAILDIAYRLSDDTNDENKHIRIDITHILHPIKRWWNISSAPLYAETAFLLKDNILRAQHQWQNRK